MKNVSYYCWIIIFGVLYFSSCHTHQSIKYGPSNADHYTENPYKKHKHIGSVVNPKDLIPPLSSQSEDYSVLVENENGELSYVKTTYGEKLQKIGDGKKVIVQHIGEHGPIIKICKKRPYLFKFMHILKKIEKY